MDASFDFSRWTPAELARAEVTAADFLSQNGTAISQVLERQCFVLNKLVSVLRQDNLSLEERLDCFARISENSEGLRDSANGFFELGSQPMVARVLSKADLPE